MRHRRKNEAIFFVICPILVAGSFLVLDHFLKATRSFELDSFVNDIINQLITVLALFVSFSLAYLSIITTSSSKNVDGLKETPSSVYILNGSNEYCSLYQVLVSEITYTLFFDIFFLFLVFIEKFVIYVSNDTIIKYIIATDIALFTHVLILMLVSIKNIYFSFWRSE
jgi:hypothetical protein